MFGSSFSGKWKKIDYKQIKLMHFNVVIFFCQTYIIILKHETEQNIYLEIDQLAVALKELGWAHLLAWCLDWAAS